MYGSVGAPGGNLGGDLESAAGRFAEAAREHPDAAGSLAVAREQLLEIVERLGGPADTFG